MRRFDLSQIGDLAGRRILVTGGNSGIGLAAVRMFAQAGAAVLLASRDAGRGEEAAALARQGARGTVEVASLDLASLASVRALSQRLRDEGRPLDVLVNNAGVMAIPRRVTEDGFEMQLGTNHLGHFALTGGLLPLLEAAPAARVVTVTSLTYLMPGNAIFFDDLQGDEKYGKWRAYAQSKLANLLFTFELERRLCASGSRVHAYACHPGYSATKLHLSGPQMEKRFSLFAALMNIGNAILAQSAEMGALPTVYAAVGDLPGGAFVGPTGFFGIRGLPRRVKARGRACDEAVAGRLWAVSEMLTALRFLS